MPDRREDVSYELALASRMLANEGVLDAFGHVSLRHPGDPTRFLLSRSRSPQLVEPADILEYTLDAEPVRAPTQPLFAERVIHGCIYQARPDVMAVCHHHARRGVAVLHRGRADRSGLSSRGRRRRTSIPFWDQQDEFGDTNLLVAKPEEGHSLARALGSHAAVLMHHHGATVVGGDLRELVSRSIFMCQNAVYQLQAHLLGKVVPLTRARPGWRARSMRCRTWWGGPGNTGRTGSPRPGGCRRARKQVRWRAVGWVSAAAADRVASDG